MAYTYDYPRPAVTVDNLIFTFEEKDLKILLIQRANPPFKGEWALPGGFVEINESLEDAAKRELREETGISNAFIKQLKTFGAVDRDPRGRIMSVAYYALVKPDVLDLRAETDARAVAWFSIYDLPELAFDHAEMVDVALARLREEFKFKPISFELLPEKFSLTELQRLYEAVIEKELDKRNFRKKILNLDLLEEADEESQRMSKRMATLYKFDKSRFKNLKEDGSKITFY